ncbi:MAG: TPM domain-containing protein [Spirochaetia bacterium]|nr:TPM domain-containing protein [Spirochaetia bacterium]
MNAAIRSFALLFLLTACGKQEEHFLSTIPNPRAQGVWTADPGNLLGDSALEINRLIASNEAANGSEIAIVLVDTIGDRAPKDFATQLFNFWGIGKKGKDNGILVLHVLDQRRIEIETGYGMEGTVPDAKCKWILDELAIPHFKKKEWGEGHLEVVRALIRGIEHPDATREQLLGGIGKQAGGEETQKKVSTPLKRPSNKTSKQKNVPYSYPLFGAVALFTALMVLFAFAGIRFTRDYKKKYDRLSRLIERASLAGIPLVIATVIVGIVNEHFFLIFLGIFLGIFGAALKMIFSFFFPGLMKKRLEAYRKHPRTCKACGNIMERLDENHEDTFLKPGQIAEEKVHSMDYDVWSCRCGEVRIDTYQGSHPQSACPKCGNKTYEVQNKQKIREATYSHSGEMVYTYLCAFCAHGEKKSFILPQLRDTSSSSSDSSSTSSSDFGGGSSGGGGSGSSY